ncbi:Phosphocholine transferase AnkX [Legionella massiliensis]|uniref:Phosphocholine transferase AnkX n=1 Tax=Legionella massiliensis TaxID=1034943 RepID=A0A078L537_9GAMM|nr:ankyrin repeat domain-containing protein [Legionella massiliensis]CDZ79184.1 Phosphocholine transferase AnkX [Legionella massiliensis]CEE14922.1 Ankyrin repeats (3 copies) [Legionella massiliensis]
MFKRNAPETPRLSSTETKKPKILFNMTTSEAAASSSSSVVRDDDQHQEQPLEPRLFLGLNEPDTQENTALLGFPIVSDDDRYCWEALVHSHLPNRYVCDNKKTNREWQGFYQDAINTLIDSFSDSEVKEIAHKLFSPEAIDTIVDLSDNEQSIFFNAIIEKLEGLMKDNDYRSTRDLAILIYYRLPRNLTTILYEQAITGHTSLSNLHWALICHHPLSNDMSTDINKVSCTPAIHLTTCFNDPQLIHHLKNLGADLDLKNLRGTTACYLAAQMGLTTVINVLIAEGVNVNLSWDGYTPLWVAAGNGHIEIVNRLLEAGALVNQPDDYNRTPLWVAAGNGHIEIVNRLLEAGALVNQPDDYNRTPLWVAAGNGHIEVVRRLLQVREIDVNHLDDYSESPLWAAVAEGGLETVNCLLQTGRIAVNQQNIRGKTPLFAAANRGHTDILNSLLQAGGDINLPSDMDVSPLYTAAINNRTEVIKTLAIHGAIDHEKSVLRYAIEEKKTEVIDAFFAGGLHFSPDDMDTFPWLAEEISRRSQANTNTRQSSLAGRSLFAYENALRDPNEIPAETLDKLGRLCHMPIGYAPDGTWFMDKAIAGDKDALAYLQTYDDKVPGSLACWFKQAGSKLAPFRLALKLVTARTAQTIELSVKEEQDFYSGHIDNLDDLCNRYDCDLLIDWLNKLIVAPEMEAFSVVCLKFSNKILSHQITTLKQDRHRIAMLEQTVSQLMSHKTEKKTIPASQRQITDFFKFDKNPDSSPVASSSSGP